MSKIKKLEVSKGWTVQTKPYESFRIDITLSAMIEPEDDVDKVYEKLSKDIDKKIEREIEGVMP